MNEKILNVYKFQTDNNQKSYVYTLKKDDDNLGFDYFILAKTSEETTIYEAKNALKVFQNNNIELIPIRKNTKEYEIFLLELQSYLKNNEKKEAVISRK